MTGRSRGRSYSSRSYSSDSYSSRSRSRSRSPPKKSRNYSPEKKRSPSPRYRKRSPSPAVKRVLVTNLTRSVQKPHLFEIFEHFGKIASLDFPINTKLNSNKGIAYITFETTDGAVEAIECMHLSQIDGNEINVILSKPVLRNGTGLKDVVKRRSKSPLRRYQTNRGRSRGRSFSSSRSRRSYSSDSYSSYSSKSRGRSRDVRK